MFLNEVMHLCFADECEKALKDSICSWNDMKSSDILKKRTCIVYLLPWVFFIPDVFQHRTEALKAEHDSWWVVWYLCCESCAACARRERRVSEVLHHQFLRWYLTSIHRQSVSKRGPTRSNGSRAQKRCMAVIPHSAGSFIFLRATSWHIGML